MAIDAVIFDYGGVISSPLFRGIGDFELAEGYPPGSLLRLLFGTVGYIGAEGRRLAARVDTSDPCDGPTASADGPLHEWQRLERGEITLDAYFASITARAPAVLGRELDLGAYERFMRSAGIGIHWPVVHHLRALRAEGMPLALLTNNVREFGDQWRSTFPCDELFDVVIDSSAVGMRKPEPEIYLLTCERIGIAPERGAFVDDNRENVEAARALGLRAILFGDDPYAALGELDALLGRDRAGAN